MRSSIMARRLTMILTVALLMAGSGVVGFLWGGLNPAPAPVTGVPFIMSLYELDGYVCGPWKPTGQPCAGGCYWQRTCYTEDGQFTQTSCRPSTGGVYCPLSSPGTEYGPEDTALNEWATTAWGGTWDSGEHDWINATGQTLQDWVEEGAE